MRALHISLLLLKEPLTQLAAIEAYASPYAHQLIQYGQAWSRTAGGGNRRGHGPLYAPERPEAVRHDAGICAFGSAYDPRIVWRGNRERRWRIERPSAQRVQYASAGRRAQLHRCAF